MHSGPEPNCTATKWLRPCFFLVQFFLLIVTAHQRRLSMPMLLKCNFPKSAMRRRITLLFDERLQRPQRGIPCALSRLRARASFLRCGVSFRLESICSSAQGLRRHARELFYVPGHMGLIGKSQIGCDPGQRFRCGFDRPARLQRTSSRSKCFR